MYLKKPQKKKRGGHRGGSVGKNEGQQQPFAPFSNELARNLLVFTLALAGNGRNANEARDAGADDLVILCQAYKESRFKFSSQAGSHRGYLQMGPTAAKDIGLTADEYDKAISEPTESIRISTRYLAKRITDAGGDLKAGLNGYGTGPGYADSILLCPGKMKSAKTLDQIYGAFLENGKP